MPRTLTPAVRKSDTLEAQKRKALAGPPAGQPLRVPTREEIERALGVKDKKGRKS